MTLSADVQARVPASRLVQLTNLTSGPTAVLTQAVLDAAIADTKAEFQTYTKILYDEANTQHTPVGVVGTLYYLAKRKGLREADELRKEWYELLARFGVAGVIPATNCPYSPSVEPAGMLPDTDRQRFNDTVPLPPKTLSPSRQQRATNT